MVSRRIHRQGRRNRLRYLAKYGELGLSGFLIWYRQGHSTTDPDPGLLKELERSAKRQRRRRLTTILKAITDLVT